MAAMERNSSDVFEPKFGTEGLSVTENINGFLIDDSETKSDLFYGYIWPGVLTMVICFVGASANIFHVLIHQFVYFFSSYSLLLAIGEIE